MASRLAMALLILVALGACADDDSQRQFANDPQATQDLVGAAPTPPATVVVPPTALPATPLAVAQLVGIPGSAESVFVAEAHRVLALSVVDGASRIAFDAGKATIRAVAPSPSGDRVAIVTTGTANDPVRVMVADAGGSQTPPVELGPAGDELTQKGRYDIAWSPNGADLLVSLAGGGIVEVQGANTVRTLLTAAQTPAPRAVAWSPSGGTIAYVAAGADGEATGLYVASLEALPLDPVAIVRPIAGRSRQIRELAWVAPVGVIYSERAADNDLSIGGDLFAVPAAGGTPRLIGTAGGVSEIGAVGEFVVAPNGQAVVYTVLTPGSDGPVASGLLVRQIDGTASLALPVAAGDAVLATAWSPSGIAWAAQSSSGIMVERATADGGAMTVVASPVAASPVGASPVAASSVGSPTAASPVALPAAASPVVVASPDAQGSPQAKASLRP